MQNLPKPIRRFAPLAALLAAVLVISGCGTTSPDIARGRVLFTSKCGICHTLAQAGTTATIGPNLDDAFAAAREAGGFDAATIEGIVQNQIDNPRPSNGNPAASMPAHTAEGIDAEDIAAYVGKYAGVPGAAPPEVEGGPGAQVFASNGCGGCHTLAAAKSGGTVGPDLDEVLPGQIGSRNRRIDRRSERENRPGLSGKRDAAELQRNDSAGRTQRTRQILERKRRQKQKIGRSRPGPRRVDPVII